MTQAKPSPPSALPKGEGETPVKITQRHYQALAGLSLGAVFLLQLQQGSGLSEIAVVINLCALFIGTISILYRVRIPPILTPCALALPMLFEQYNLTQLNLEVRSLHSVDVADVLLCVSMLTYVVAMYRLQGLRFGLLPADRRLPAATAARSEESLSAAELLGLVVPIPAAALFAQVALLALRQRWSLYELPPRWQQFVLIAWALLLAFFVFANAFQYWRRLQMDRTTALVLLQDILWRETRSEQRTINRWIAWQKLRDRK